MFILGLSAIKLKRLKRGGGGHSAIPGEKNCQIKAFKSKTC